MRQLVWVRVPPFAIPMNPLQCLTSREYRLVLEGKKDLTKHDSEAAFYASCEKIGLLWAPLLFGELGYTVVYSPHLRSRSLKEELMVWVTLFYPIISLGLMSLYRYFWTIDIEADKELRCMGNCIQARSEGNNEARVFHGISDYWKDKSSLYAKVCHCVYGLLAQKASKGHIVKENPEIVKWGQKVGIKWRNKSITLLQEDDVSTKVTSFFEKCWT
ncbi:MAG: hypothetical protein JSR58_00075 [Verrucomicrobia bacterium]|nr:hypothetical protein [Verrucomicrobiota bacterium]